MMVPALSLYVILVWSLWGFFMGMGWAVGTWLIGKVLARIG